MDTLKIEPTELTPGVIMDPIAKRFEIAGESRPENAGEFYKEILDWMDKYFAMRYWKDDKFGNKGQDKFFEFKLEYFNSTSAKFLLDIFKKLGEFKKDDINIKVKWHYAKLDID